MDCFAWRTMTVSKHFMSWLFENEIRSISLGTNAPHSRSSSSAKAGDPVFRGARDERKSRGVLDTPLEPVIGLAEGETRWRV
jgi:hypothetical protein